jgi:hypothetical protein
MNKFKDSTNDAVGEYYQAQRWRAEGVAEERKRIIELIEDTRNNCGCYEIGMLVCRHTPTIDELINLIKGENK